MMVTGAHQPPEFLLREIAMKIGWRGLMISIGRRRDSVSKFLSGILSVFILVVWFFKRPPLPILPPPILPPTLPERPTFRTTLCLCLAVCVPKAGGDPRTHRERERKRERDTRANTHLEIVALSQTIMHAATLMLRHAAMAIL
jgi:hypothetical protein